MTTADTVAQLLASPRTVAVVGLSPKPHRDSYRVAHYLQQHGWRIVPVHPGAAASGERILGETVYATLTEAACAQRIDLVDVFRNSADVPPVVDEAIAMGAPAIWLQLGITNDTAMARAQAAGLQCVQDRCLMVEHRRAAAA